VPARIALLTVAVAALIWFAFGVRQARDERAASAIVSRLGALSPDQADRAAAALDRAGTLNPDAHVDVLRAELALHRHDVASARRILDGVVRHEPQDIEAWALLADALRRSDPAAAAAARARVLRLAPPVPAP
jgi:predicted Zn-dependent protease